MEKKLDRKKRHNETIQLIREDQKKEENFDPEPPTAPTASTGADTSNGVGVADGSNTTDTASATSTIANNDTSVASASSNHNGSDGGAALLTASNTNDPSNTNTSNANNSTSSIGASLDNNLLMPQLTAPILPRPPPLPVPTHEMSKKNLYIFGMEKFMHTAFCLVEVFNHQSEELKGYHENQFTANRDPQQEMLQKQELYAKLVDALNTVKTQWARAYVALKGGNRLGMENLLNYDIPVDDEDDDATDAAVA